MKMAGLVGALLHCGIGENGRMYRGMAWRLLPAAGDQGEVCGLRAAQRAHRIAIKPVKACGPAIASKAA